MRVNSPGAEDAGCAGGAAGCGADAPGAGGLTELNILVNAPGSGEAAGVGWVEQPPMSGSGGSFLSMGTWLKTRDKSSVRWGGGAGLPGAAGSFVVNACNIRVNSPGAGDSLAVALAAGAEGGPGLDSCLGAGGAGAGASPCFRREASRSSSAATGSVRNCPKIPVALAGSPPGTASPPRNSGFSVGFLGASIAGHLAD